MQFTDEDLIAFLLGDASEELSRQIEQAMASQPRLLERIGFLRLLLGQINSVGSVYEPPADLVDTTLARIDAVDSCEASAQPNALANALANVTLREIPRRSSLWDSSALTICLTVLCCLALPALVEVRFQSRRAQCALQLGERGFELINFAINDPSQRFPFVSVEGPGAFAGVYAVRLLEAGIPITPQQLSCASLLGFQPETQPLRLDAIPTFADLEQLDLDDLKLVQQSIGGDYAYNLGIQEQGHVHAPKCEGRSQFAILADAPMILGNREQFIAHDGRGINILYEDGRVVFLSKQALCPRADEPLLHDNPFCNSRGQHEVGLHREDASLAPSHFPPVSR